MPEFELTALEESSIAVSGGEQLSGIDQGDGSHLVGETITLLDNDFEFVTITDNDDFFDDNDGNQFLTNAITYNGISYDEGDRVEAEYQIVVQDPDGNQYTLVGFNINGPGGQPFGSVEGLAFLNDFPPVGVPLTVMSASEGPDNFETPFTEYFTPPCFVAGTLIASPDGARPVETFQPGQLVNTLDNGPQPLVWVGKVNIPQETLLKNKRLRPIRLANGLMVSAQHRLLVEGWMAELYCGADSVLVPAAHFAAAGMATEVRAQDLPDGVTYHHIMFDTHQIVFSNDVPTESFCPGPATMRAMPDAAREFQALFTDFKQSQLFPPCRHQAKEQEARLLLAAH